MRARGFVAFTPTGVAETAVAPSHGAPRAQPDGFCGAKRVVRDTATLLYVEGTCIE